MNAADTDTNVPTIYMLDPRNVDNRAEDDEHPLYALRAGSGGCEPEPDIAYLLIDGERDDDGDICIEPRTQPRTRGVNYEQNFVEVPPSISREEISSLADEPEFARLVIELVDAGEHDVQDAHEQLVGWLRERYDRAMSGEATA